LKDRVRSAISTRNDEVAISNMEWLGLLSDSPILDGSSKVDALSKLLESKLVYRPGERDMIILQHVFITEIDGNIGEIRSTMIDHGIPGGDSAMSRTVGIPAAIGTDMLLKDETLPRGVLVPTIPEIYKPALEKLAVQGIRFTHS
jgi:saccharopine dehydrogenase-like NADP-dependent oxidoreductase